MNKNKDAGPLVSVIVITWNSSEFVLETLESIKSQSYRNIELVVTDDGSADGTVELCRGWILANRERFERAELITAEKNAGIPSNCNRGMSAARGEWIKFIAGDDLLAPDCIGDFIRYVNRNPDAKVVESCSRFFRDSFAEQNFLHVRDFGDHVFFHELAGPGHQYEMLLRKNFLHGPSMLYHREVMAAAGGFDERYRFIEDHPFWLKLTKAGYKVHFLNKITVFYRVHASNIQGSHGRNKLFNDFYLKRRRFDLECIYPGLTPLERICRDMEHYRKVFLDKTGMNRNYAFFRMIDYVTRTISPIYRVSGRHLRRIEKEVKEGRKRSPGSTRTC